MFIQKRSTFEEYLPIIQSSTHFLESDVGGKIKDRAD